MQKTDRHYEVVIIGSGVSGSFWAHALTKAGKKCLVLEAGTFYNRTTYPRTEVDANSRLYWSGGVELNKQVSLALLRPKVVGGGSIVNQALVDRCYDDILEKWARESGNPDLLLAKLSPYYALAESELSIQQIPEKYWNDNAHIFRDGFARNGFKCSPVRRAQKDCRYEDGNDCIECLAGCPLDSKQSMPVTVLKKALAAGCELLAECEVTKLEFNSKPILISALQNKQILSIRADHLVLAAGAIGNARLTLASGFAAQLPAIGKGFYIHPQYMVLAEFARKVAAFKSAFQVLRSDDERFRQQGFKLENVFAPPAALAMLIPGFGKNHQETLSRVNHIGCMEVAIRDTHPGTIALTKAGRTIIDKRLNEEDKKRRNAGLETIHKVFKAAGAKRFIPVQFGIGLHLMGGMALGTDRKRSVVGPDFRLHGHRNIYVSDSSTFPSAPGINPSLTIMAMTLRAAESMLGEMRSGV